MGDAVVGQKGEEIFGNFFSSIVRAKLDNGMGRLVFESGSKKFEAT